MRRISNILGGAKWKRGSELAPNVQKQALGQFVYRFTGDHKPAWSKEPWRNGDAYPLQFKDDVEWLDNTWFNVTSSGELDKREQHYESHPTWPENPELRTPPEALSPAQLA